MELYLHASNCDLFCHQCDKSNISTHATFKIVNEMTAIFQLFDNKTILFSHVLTPLLHMQVLSKQNVDDPIQKL